MARVSQPTSNHAPSANRRDLLVEAAAEAFWRDGYQRSSLTAIAKRAGVTAPALYRHFGGKEELLAACILESLRDVAQALVRHQDGPLEQAADALAATALRHRSLWVLLQREARALGPEQAQRIEAAWQEVVHRLGSLLERTAPTEDYTARQLRTTGFFAVLSTPSWHASRLAAARQQELLAGAACRVARAPLPPPPSVPETTVVEPEVEPASTASLIVRSAALLFHARGFDAVTIDDLGAAVGIAGPSVYHHFATKQDVLVAVFDEAVSALEAMQVKVPGDSSLARLVGAYCDQAWRRREVLGVLLTESGRVPATVRRRFRDAAQRDEARWARAYVAAGGIDDLRVAQLLASASRGAIHDMLRLVAPPQQVDPRPLLEAVALAVLDPLDDPARGFVSS
jgi:AcrR family transcriptional regulator